MNNPTATSTDFKSKLESYVQQLNATAVADYEKNYKNLLEVETPSYRILEGPRWVKILNERHTKDGKLLSSSMFAFIDPQTGDIYKPAGWKAPAKGIRGNIFNDKLPLDAGQLYRYR